MRKVIEKLIPMKEISMDERRDILLECQIEDSVIVRQRHNISLNTLNHIKFFHGDSSAKARGYYYKDLLDGVVNPVVERVKELKKEGKNSGQVASMLNISLEKMNKIYEKA